ncbi:MAG: Uma2 family endonuclease [Chloroflexi bacterium]|nr:Uma2 family endonuclease [Chloroflexota bacterium]
MATAIPRRRFTVKDYYRMAKAGILKPDERVELLDGEIVPMSPIGSPHAAAVNRANRLFNRLVGDRAIVAVQNPVRLDEHSEPDPDVALLRPRADDYARGHPGPRDVLLIVEVVDTSEALDRRLKLPLYARAGVPEVWLLVLKTTARRPEPVLEVNRRPGPRGYADARLVRRGERAAPELLPDVAITLDELLGD